MHPAHLFPGFFCGALVPALLFAAEPRPTLQPAHAPAPLYPLALANEPVNYGSAWIGCTVDDDGRVIETWILRASHPAFGEAAEDALRAWRYAPRAEPAPGAGPAAAPWPRSEVVRFDFGRPGNVTSFPAVDSVKGIFPYPPEAGAGPAELPLLPPRSLKRLAGPSPRPPAGAPPGRVLVEFVVDEAGRVRLPVALEADHPALARATVEALRGWRFEPPTERPEAPGVRLRWAFRFGPAPAPGTPGGEGA